MIFPTTMIPYVNISLMILIVLMVVLGFYKGFLMMAIDFFSMVITFLLSFLIAPMIAAKINIAAYFNIDVGIEGLNKIIEVRVNGLLWFLLTFVVLMILFALLTAIFKRVGSIPVVKEVNHVLGGILGLFKAYLLLLLFIFVLSTPFVRNGQIVIEQTMLSDIHEKTASAIVWFEEPTQFNQMLQDLMNNKSIKSENVGKLTEWLRHQIGDEFLNDIIKQIHVEGE